MCGEGVYFRAEISLRAFVLFKKFIIPEEETTKAEPQTDVYAKQDPAVATSQVMGSLNGYVHMLQVQE